MNYTLNTHTHTHIHTHHTNTHAHTYTHIAEETDGAFSKGTQWLVWKFESDATLGDALDGQLGSFPGCLQVNENQCNNIT
jgi:hypothetical protein